MWRAFVKGQTEGQTGRPDLKAIAMEFNSLKRDAPSTLEPYRFLSRLAAVQDKSQQDQVARSAFGPRVAHAKHRSKHLFFNQFWRGHKGDTTTTKAQHLQRLACTGHGLPACTQLAKHCAKETTKETFARSEKCKVVVNRSQESLGKRQLSELREKLPALQAFPFETVFMSPLVQTYQLSTSHIPEKCIRFCSWATQHKDSNVGIACDRFWADLHATIPQHPNPPEAPATKQSACVEAGMCICKGRGRIVQKMVASVNKYVKTNCQASAQFKAALLAGFVVLQLVGEELEEAVAEPRSSRGEYWLHVGLQYQRPWRPTYHQLVRVPPPPAEASVSLRLHRVFLQVTRAWAHPPQPFFVVPLLSFKDVYICGSEKTSQLMPAVSAEASIKPCGRSVVTGH